MVNIARAGHGFTKETVRLRSSLRGRAQRPDEIAGLTTKDVSSPNLMQTPGGILFRNSNEKIIDSVPVHISQTGDSITHSRAFLGRRIVESEEVWCHLCR